MQLEDALFGERSVSVTGRDWERGRRVLSSSAFVKDAINFHACCRTGPHRCFIGRERLMGGAVTYVTHRLVVLELLLRVIFMCLERALMVLTVCYGSLHTATVASDRFHVVWEDFISSMKASDVEEEGFR